MQKVVLQNKPTKLFFTANGQLFAYVNIKPEYTEETKFVKSAFVKTGRMIPTGNYTALRLLVSSKPGALRLPFSKIQNLIDSAISKYVDDKILKGFVWNGYKVWLSKENQQNYASWLTAARMSSDALPFKAKFNMGWKDSVVYYEFSTVDELENFYSKMVKFINDVVNEGRELKDNFRENIHLYKSSYSS